MNHVSDTGVSISPSFKPPEGGVIVIPTLQRRRVRHRGRQSRVTRSTRHRARIETQARDCGAFRLSSLAKYLPGDQGTKGAMIRYLSKAFGRSKEKPAGAGEGCPTSTLRPQPARHPFIHFINRCSTLRTFYMMEATEDMVLALTHYMGGRSGPQGV